jgi:5-hydroxyisourate hydrolase-like protein (transthyretin family)
LSLTVALALAYPQAPQLPPRDAPRPGAATAAVSGTVTDRETGKPLRRMKVWLRPYAGGPPGSSTFDGVTDAEGRYAIAGVPAGHYTVSAGPDEFGAGHQSSGYRDLSLEAGTDRSAVDFALERTYAIEGRVTNEFGEGLADLVVAAERVDRPSAQQPFTITDDRGLFRLHGLERGRWRICARALSGVSASAAPPGPGPPPYVRTCVPDEAVDRTAAIHLQGGVEGVDVQMQRGLERVTAPVQVRLPAPLRGTSVVSGRVVERDTGAPLARAIVTFAASRADRATFVARGTTDQDGRFEVRNLPSGSLSITAWAGEHRATHVAWHHPPRTARGGQTVTLKEGERRADVRIALVRSVAVSGRVTDEEGQPLARATVRLRAAGGGPLFNGVQERLTDDRGLFRLFGVPPGDYVVCADMSRHDDQMLLFRDSSPVDRFVVDACHPSSSTEQDAQAIGVTADVDGIEIVARRSRTFTVSGLVVDATGTATEPRTVMLHRYGAFGANVTGIRAPHGVFAFRNLVPGDYALEARLGGADGSASFPWAARAYVPLKIVAADVPDLVVALQGPVTVPGRVVFEDGPPADRELSLSIETAMISKTEGRLLQAQVAADLSFTLENLFGPVRLKVHGVPRGWIVKAIRYGGEDITDATRAFESGSRDVVEVTLTSRGAVVSGAVTDESRRPAEGAVVYLLPAGEKAELVTLVSYTVLEGGRFSTGSIRPGDYLIAAVSAEQAELLTERPRLVARLARYAERITLVENDRVTLNLRVVTLPER